MEDQPAMETMYQPPMRSQSSNILFLTNPNTAIYNLELTYRGYMEDHNNQLKKVGEPLMNDEGINSVLGLVHSIVNQVTIMSNISKNELPNLMNFLADALAKDLMLNRVTYEITSASARDKIFTSALNLSYITLKRSYEEGDKRFWKGSVQEQKMTVENNTKKGGLLNMINPWSR